MNDWEIIETYIKEHGQGHGSVSWQMAQGALGRLRQEHERYSALRVAAILSIEDIETGFPSTAKQRLKSILQSSGGIAE